MAPGKSLLVGASIILISSLSAASLNAALAQSWHQSAQDDHDDDDYDESAASTDHPYEDENEDEAEDDDAEDNEPVTGPYNDPEEIATYGNGIGPDPDGDSNPATNTRVLSRIGDAAEAAFDPPYKVVTFEAPPGSHDDAIRSQYAGDHGVRFSRGLNRQICEGQRYFQYNSQCTYMRAPSGRYAAVYQDDFKRPLRIRFDKPVCVAAMAIYPTGGKEDEIFEVTLQGYDAGDQPLKGSDGKDLAPVKATFVWTEDTFRWRHMAGAFFTDHHASRVDVSMKSLDKKEKGKIVRFLLDDVAFIEGACSAADAAAAIKAQPAPESGTEEVIGS